MRRLMLFGLLALVGCATTSAETRSTPDYSLIKAQHDTCQTQGTALATYLDTGKPTSNDAAWGAQRQKVLSAKGESRALYIRQVADEYILQCDQQESQREAAMAAAKEQAEKDAARAKAEMEARAAAQALTAKMAANCAQVGGKWGPGQWSAGVCRIDYKSSGDGQIYHYVVAFDQAGNITPGGARSAADCATYWGKGLTGIWHSDTLICAL
jgi:hypothetical protein